MIHIKNVNQQATHTRLQRFLPEPKGRGVDFKRIMDVAAGVLGKGALSSTGLDTSLQDLLNRQVELQQQMMTVSMQSNIEKTNHDTKMAPVRNLRVG